MTQKWRKWNKMAKKTTQNMVYISRDQNSDSVDIWVDKPERKNNGFGTVYFVSKTCEETVLPIEDFRKIFGYTPRKGRCSLVMPLMKNVRTEMKKVRTKVASRVTKKMLRTALNGERSR